MGELNNSRVPARRGMPAAWLMAFVLHAPEAAPAGEPLGVPQRPAVVRLPPVDGYWSRTVTGNWAWVETRPARPQSNAPVAKATPTTALCLPVPQPIKHLEGFRPYSVHGVKWYLDGRSFFSD